MESYSGRLGYMDRNDYSYINEGTNVYQDLHVMYEFVGLQQPCR